MARATCCVDSFEVQERNIYNCIFFLYGTPYIKNLGPPLHAPPDNVNEKPKNACNCKQRDVTYIYTLKFTRGLHLTQLEPAVCPREC
jgi:hypothetical protein